MTTDREFNQLVASERMSSGMWAEMIVAADLFKRGYIVSKPLVHTTKYDLIADRGGSDRPTVQVKLGAKGTLQVNLAKKSGFRNYQDEFSQYGDHGWKEKRSAMHPLYKEGDFDYLAVVDRLDGSVYYVKWADIDHSKGAFTVKLDQKDRFKDI